MPPTINLVPLRLAAWSEVRDAVTACRDAMTQPDNTLAMWQRRHQHTLTHDTSDMWGACVIADAHGGAGWTGWVPYQEQPGTWQSTTWLAPRLRGTGLLEQLRCDQIHRAAALKTRWNLQHMTLVSSIDATNTRSLTASRRYADARGWTDWTSVTETVRPRQAWLLTWPANLDDHPCHLPSRRAAAGTNTT